MSVLTKLKRIKPMLRAKKALVDKETMTLAQIIQEKNQTLHELQRCQQAYLEGINELNKQRCSEYRTGQDFMERSVDYAKDLWTQLFKDAQLLDKKITAQRSVLFSAKRNLKEVEKLHERYEFELRKLANKQEQDFLDEFHLGSQMRQK